VVNLPVLTEAAAGLGFFSFPPSPDGIVRVVPLVGRGSGHVYPALSVEALRTAQGAGTFIIRATGASGEIDTGRPAMTAVAQATAVIAAAGSGERLGAGVPKALVPLAGRPLVAWCLDAFAAAESVDATVIVAPPGHEDQVASLAPRSASLRVVGGGATRAESVRGALEVADGDLVAIHDAARPFVTAELVDELVAKLADRPDAAGVIAAAPLADTVKRAREPRPAQGGFERGGPTVAKTESRDHLWAAQTPQAFRLEALRDAFAADPQRVAEATDEAVLVEKAGGKVLIHPAPASNLKVTTPDDLRVAELLLGSR
jgi:2-C-methyl-D-erythritol 4-phosphate cytidylyltransferase